MFDIVRLEEKRRRRRACFWFV